VSSTMTDPEWQNSTVLSGDPVEEVRALKEQSGQDIVVTGSITLCHTLIRAGLVDEYRLFVYPVVQGRGRRLFPDAEAEAARGQGLPKRHHLLALCPLLTGSTAHPCDPRLPHQQSRQILSCMANDLGHQDLVSLRGTSWSGIQSRTHIAAAGGADRRSAKKGPRHCINRAKRITRPFRSTFPRGPCATAKDVFSDRCAAKHAAMRTGRRPAKVLFRWALGLVGFGPRYTSSLIGMIQAYLDLENGRRAYCWSKAICGPGRT
jgi:hypothetical protein